jgi:hypothetical protein
VENVENSFGELIPNMPRYLFVSCFNSASLSFLTHLFLIIIDIFLYLWLFGRSVWKRMRDFVTPFVVTYVHFLDYKDVKWWKRNSNFIITVTNLWNIWRHIVYNWIKHHHYHHHHHHHHYHQHYHHHYHHHPYYLSKHQHYHHHHYV